MLLAHASSPLAAALIGVTNALLIAGGIAGLEIFVLRAAALGGFRRLPFAVVLVSKSLFYAAFAAAVLAAAPGERFFGVPPLSASGDLARTVGFALAVTTVFIIVLQAAGLVGYRTFRDLMLGRYHRPRAERRFFLFADVVGSTALAERLGPLAAHQFLADVFTALAEPVASHQGEIYQYVGDEIVVTWTAHEGALNARPLRCYFAMCAALGAKAALFRERFGASPELRAALHLGDVIAGEVGQERRAIVFHGDAMNTAARLEQATREVGCRFIVSAEARAALGPLPAFEMRDLGALVLRGRREPLHAYGCEKVVG